MISSPPQVPSGTLGVASSTRNYLHIITTSLSVYASVILHPNPSNLLPFYCDILQFHLPVLSFSADPFPGNDMTPSLVQWTSLCLLFQFICPFNFTCPFSSCPFWLMLNTTWGLYDFYLCSSHASPLAKMLLSLQTWYLTSTVSPSLVLS